MTLRLPAVLKVIAGTDRLSLRGSTVAELLEAAFEEVPVLRPHLTLETGRLRPHVLCLVNGESLPREGAEGATLASGDEVWIHQAISGG